MKLPVLGQVTHAPARDRSFFPEAPLPIRAVHIMGAHITLAPAITTGRRVLNWTPTEMSPEALIELCKSQTRIPILLGLDALGFDPRMRIQIGRPEAPQTQTGAHIHLPRARTETLRRILETLDQEVEITKV